MPYLYQSARSRVGEFTQIEIQRDDGTAMLLRQGKTYDLSSTEAERANRYIVLVSVSTPVDDTPVGVTYLPIRGTPAAGQVPIWDQTSGVFVPGDIASTLPQQYLGIYFGGDDVKGEQLTLAYSRDGTNFSPLSSPVSGVPRSRDQDVIDWYGFHLLAYTKAPAFGVVSTGFGLMVSSDVMTTWNALPDVSMAAITGIKRAWGPCWVKDATTLRCYIGVTTTDSDLGPFSLYETHPTDLTFTSWSTPVNVSSGLPSSVFDFITRKVGSTWVALYKNNATEFIERATSTSPLGPWTVTHTGDWMGHAAALGTSPPAAEGAHIETLPNGNTRLWFDRYRIPPGGDYRAARTYYSDTSDPNLASGWSAPVISDGLGRHARVRRMPLPSSFAISVPSPHIELARIATYAAPNTYFTPIAWDFVDEDKNGMFDSSVDNTLATVRVGGLFAVSFNAVFLTGASGNVFSGVMFNESYDPGVTDKRSGAGFDPAISFGFTRRLRRGDRVAAAVQSDVARNLGTSPPPRLRVSWVGP